MDSLFRAAESLTPVAMDRSSTVPNWMTMNDDQNFLLLFIMGTYFGPDLKAEKPKKSVMQRVAEGLPTYTTDQLVGSQLKTVEAERVYYYVVRKAFQSVVVKLPLLRQFFQGNLFTGAQDHITDHRQFPDLFPPHLHPQTRFRGRYKIIENIVFINNPEISYIKPEDVERFKRLTGLEEFLLNRDAARYWDVGVGGLLDNNLALEQSKGESSFRRSSRSSRKRKEANDHLEAEVPCSPIHDVIPASFMGSFSDIPVRYGSVASFPAEANARPVRHGSMASLPEEANARPVQHGSMTSLPAEANARPVRHGSMASLPAEARARPVRHGSMASRPAEANAWPVGHGSVASLPAEVNAGPVQYGSTASLPTEVDAEPVRYGSMASLPAEANPGRVRYSSRAKLPAEVNAWPVEERIGPTMLFLPSHPTTGEWNDIVAATRSAIALSGSVAERKAGPLVGLVDIGVCDDAYLFRMYLPGVRKDEREFSCKVEADGRVLVQGVTVTGEKWVYKNSQMFKMQTQYLCPPGHFSISFKLPGPVEHEEFSGTFGPDGMLEGVVMKARSARV